MKKNKAKDMGIKQGLLEFLENSPTPFHVVKNMKQKLDESGYKELSESKPWKLQKNSKYYVTRNNSSIFAFQLGSKSFIDSGIRLVGTHTDSPCLKVKPNPEIKKHTYFQLGVEVYGGVLLSTWFDRDLSLAGRVSYTNKAHQLKEALIDFKEPIAMIPNLAIHLNRNANENKTMNPQQELPPLLFQGSKSQETDFKEILLQQLKAEKISDAIRVLDYDLSFYDTQKPQTVGLHQDFIASSRLDNLLSCYVGLESLLNAPSSENIGLICSDHEEVGSASYSGAEGNLLYSSLLRLAGTHENFTRMIDQSMLISADNAHGIHPNYSEKHDSHHAPILNHGPVIKINANQRYATNSVTSAKFALICEKAKVPYQKFVVRSDMGCGSTIGPITATKIGIETVDIGVPTFAMHSIRETAGVKDVSYLYHSLLEFYS